ncbi:MAG: DinB family protein [Conexivisphaerales archaeon]
MITIRELHQYSSTVRRAFLEKLASLPWEVVTKNREASFNSMKDIMLHMIDNEDMVVSGQILRVPDYRRAREWEEYRDIKMIREHLDEVEKKTEAYLEKADENELGRRVTFTVRSGTFDLSAEECLLQSFTEQLFHIGELIALLWQENVEPPRMQWFWNNPRTRASKRS